MSVIGTNHMVAKLEKNSKSFEGQRMARVIAKKNKEGAYECEHLNESKFVSVPMLNASNVNENQLQALMPHILGMIANAQDTLIREAIIQTGASSIADEQISVDACIKLLDDESKGNRITGEYVSKWFTETYADAAVEFVAALCKFGSEQNSWTEEQNKVVETKVNVLASMFAGFASGKYSPDIPKCKAMIRFSEFLTDENMDARMQNYVAKAQKIKAEKEAEMSADALGF